MEVRGKCLFSFIKQFPLYPVGWCFTHPRAVLCHDRQKAMEILCTILPTAEIAIHPSVGFMDFAVENPS